MADIRRENVFLFSGFQWWRNTVPELIHRGRLSIIFLHLIFFLTFLHHIFAIEVLFDLQKWYLKKVFNFRDKINRSVSCLRVELEQIFFIWATVTAFKMLASFSRCLLIRPYVILISWSVILSFLSYLMIYHYSKAQQFKEKALKKKKKKDKVDRKIIKIVCLKNRKTISNKGRKTNTRTFISIFWCSNSTPITGRLPINFPSS